MSLPSAQLSIFGRLSRDIAVLYGAALGLVVLELLTVARGTTIGAREALAYLAFGAVVLGWTSLLVGCASAAFGSLGSALALRVIPRERLRAALSAAVCGLVTGGLGVAIIRPWALYRDPMHFAFSLPIASVVAALLWWLARSKLRASVVAVVVLTACAGCFLVNASWYRGLYISLHRAASWLIWIAAACALGGLWASVAHRRAARLAPLALFAAAHLGVPLMSVAHELSVIHGTMVPMASAVLRSIDDGDLDGYSARFRGGDCDDTDPSVRPGVCEIPGNRRDDNCNGLVDPSFAARPVRARTARTPLPDIYLLMLDTLRADFGGAGRAAASPTLEALARESLDFARAYTPYPATYRALSAMVQSRSPRTSDPAHEDLVTVLAAHGYDAQLWLGDERRMIGAPSQAWPLRSKQQFRADYTHASYGLHSQRICDDAIAELAEDDPRPRFRWLHLLDLHTPWVHAPGKGSLRERYAIELAHVEALLAKLFAAFEAHPRSRSAVIIVIGDHGEQLGEHGATFHDAFVWEESIRVPMIMRLPGVAPRVIDSPASLLDVAPTVLSVLGLPEPRTFQGHDWLSAPERRETPPIAEVDESALARWGPPARIAVIGDRYKLSLNVSENLFELYDLARDPGESMLLPREGVREADELLDHLRRYQDAPGCRDR